MISNQDIKSMNYGGGKKKKICLYDCLKNLLVIKTHLKVSEISYKHEANIFNTCN